MPRDSNSATVAATTAQAPPAPQHEVDRFRSSSLTVAHGPDRSLVGRSLPLDDDLAVFGRDVDGPGMSIEDALMSRVHFRIVFDPRTPCHRLGDAQSRNGTHVNGARVTSVPLEPGDVVRAGDTVFVYGDPTPLAAVEDWIARAAKTSLSVLLLGETGTGKERLARGVHEQSGRPGRWVAVNCAALPRELLAAELFGHTRGAFSGAAAPRPGLFVTADQGTLFLDEIGDLPLELQAILLRVLEEGSVRPVGADHEVPVDVRIVSATHADLEQAVREKRFRADLYARLAQAVVRVPPLRERRAQVLPLSREFAKAAGRAELAMSADAAEALARWDWPFNVRELESLVVAFVSLHRGDTLDVAYLREHHPELVRAFRPAAPHAPDHGPDDARPGMKDRASLEEVLRRHGGNVSLVAKELGKPRAQIYRWLRALGLSPDRYR